MEKLTQSDRILADAVRNGFVFEESKSRGLVFAKDVIYEQGKMTFAHPGTGKLLSVGYVAIFDFDKPKSLRRLGGPATAFHPAGNGTFVAGRPSRIAHRPSEFVPRSTTRAGRKLALTVHFLNRGGQCVAQFMLG
ncbi:MAG: hypothetical protein ACYDCD_02595 [Candidatus Acidiferrales bacterium]